MVKKLLYLNGLAILSVVMYHASSWGFISMFWWTHRYRPVGTVNFDQLGNIEYFGLRFIEQLVAFAIPAFIFLSGYFIAFATGKNSKTISWDTVLNRVKNLLVPFLIWSIVYLLSSELLLDVRYSPLDFFLRIVTGRAADPFYFIPLLIQFYLLSPILVSLIQKRPKTILLISVIVQLIVLIFRYIAILRSDLKLFISLSNSILFSSYIFWFIFGAVVEKNLANIKKYLVRYKKLFLFALFFFLVAGMIEWEVLFRLSGQDWIGPAETLIDQLYALFIILIFITFEKVQFPLSKTISSFGTKSYGIYLSHTLALIYTAKIIYHFIPSVLEYQILFQPILIFTGLAFPLLLMYLIDKTFLRKYYSFLFG